MRTSDLVLRFVSSIGRPSEAEFYLSSFRAQRRERFAVIAVADAVMRDAAAALALDLRLLAQLDLTPVIVLGAVTPGPAKGHAHTVRNRLHPEVACEVATADTAAELAINGTIPLVTIAPGIADIDSRFEVVAELARTLQTRKVIFLGRRSGLQPEGGVVPSLVDLTTEYDDLAADGVLPPKQRALLRQIRRIVDAVPHYMTVAVTSPLDLLRELFTVRGAGTLLRRGSVVTRHDDYAGVDTPRLTELVESAFRRKLTDGLPREAVCGIWIADDYRGAAILLGTKLGPYLTKFAVDAGARGEGIGRDLWRALERDCATLFWRSRADNPITPWYTEQCQGMVRTDDWHVFWRGLTPDQIADAVAYARAAPVDLVDARAD